MKSNSLQHSPLSVEFRGVMDITSASKAEGSGFDPHQGLRIFLKMLRLIFKMATGLLLVLLGGRLTSYTSEPACLSLLKQNSTCV